MWMGWSCNANCHTSAICKAEEKIISESCAGKAEVTYSASRLAKLIPSTACIIASTPITFGTGLTSGSCTIPSFVDASVAMCSSPKGEPYDMSPGEIDPPAIPTRWAILHSYYVCIVIITFQIDDVSLTRVRNQAGYTCSCTWNGSIMDNDNSEFTVWRRKLIKDRIICRDENIFHVLE